MIHQLNMVDMVHNLLDTEHNHLADTGLVDTDDVL